MRTHVLSATFFLLAACGGVDPVGDPADTSFGALTPVSGFGSNPGGLVMRAYVPSRGVGQGAALVVALHGCAQTADDYVRAGWNDLADQVGFYVVYPEQQTANEQTRCFRWWNPNDTTRDRGEALSVRQMVDWMKGHYSIDPGRVYVTGLSSGAAMTASLLAAYPDVFTAGAIMAGIPAGCASSLGDAYSCMSPGRDLPQSTWADRARAADRSWTGPYPRVSIWHGTSDYTVLDANRVQLERQWTGVHGISDTPARSEIVDGATHAIFAGSSGETLVESYSIPGMGHGAAVDPGFAPAGGCGAAGAFILDEGICSTYFAWAFFEGTVNPGPTDAGVPDAGRDAGFVILDASMTFDASILRDAGRVLDGGAQRPDSGHADSGQPFACREYQDTNYGHVQHGRAVRCGIGGSYVCAVGSGTQFGLWNLVPSWLKQTAPGYFDVGRCP